MRSVVVRCTSETGDEIEFVEVGDEVGVYVFSTRKTDKPELVETIYLSPDDARALFNWLGVRLHKFGPGRSDDNQGP